ncbi:MAG: hypothetical protein AVDCRST_MAG43-1625 [uncultured Thermomicrobiales bacterium]|uniref:Uncharacterized protein n=1 Tax=uncultured Thermomicrobiales bacterium TaxID=1645740 RepID=A0A6J4UTI3_9BACT|nr:MAG: hypothetical protein AVDCRST_MAG43-1625 [uncultured Thermomicrobiales bacterium]
MVLLVLSDQVAAPTAATGERPGRFWTRLNPWCSLSTRRYQYETIPVGMRRSCAARQAGASGELLN